MKQRLWLWIAIISLAAILRLYRIADIPPGLSWDEVSIGYNAYSILKTGKDEHGKFLPVDTFAAYGDYKPPVSVYATVPFVALFGLNEQAVRLPSALAGIALVALLLPLVRQLLADSKSKSDQAASVLGLTATAVMAVSPWHINLSRAGFEANIATTLVAAGVYAVLRSRSAARWRWWCWLPFVVSMYTFNSARYVVPLLGLTLLWFVRKSVPGSRRSWGTGVVIAALALLPIVPHLLSPAARLRFAEVNIFSDSSVVIRANERIAADGNTLLSKLVNNRRIGYARSYLTHYFDHFEPWFLFIRGDGNPKFSIQDVGQLYLVEAPFLLIGIFWWLTVYRRAGLLLLAWLLLAIVPAATARETPHALRIENTLPVWQVFIAGGVLAVMLRVRRLLPRRLLVLALVCLWAGNVVYYLHNYYNHYPRQYSGEWQYGYREAIREFGPLAARYDRIVLSERIGRAYMYVLFYTGYDPETFRRQKQSFFDAAGFYTVTGFDKFVFVKEAPTLNQPGTLYVLPPDQVPQQAKVISTVRLLNGRPVLVLFE